MIPWYFDFQNQDIAQTTKSDHSNLCAGPPSKEVTPNIRNLPDKSWLVIFVAYEFHILQVDHVACAFHQYGEARYELVVNWMGTLWLLPPLRTTIIRCMTGNRAFREFL
jgi:hypothetical protein